ncbi:PqqD family peptide modification chaperone [bacterium]|nr:PqqD family peptide modification chaperone [bacterium]MBU1613764.1 PqqD family peptide modification chaperone [bacterium]
MEDKLYLKKKIFNEVADISLGKGYETRVEIGGVVFSIKTDDYKLKRLIKKRFKTFVSKNTPDLFIEVQIREQIQTKGFGEIEVVKGKGENLFIHSPYAGLVDLEQRKGKLAIRMREDVSPVETFLRICSSYFLPDYDGVLLHAASVNSYNKGFVFCGQSECGKSTIARLSRRYSVFTDEISIIRRIGNTYRVFSTPFWGEMQGGIADVNSSAKVETIFFPRKNKKVYLKKITSFKSLPEIMRSTLFFANDDVRAQKIFELCHGIAEKIPCYELHFLPDNSFWRCILMKEKLLKRGEKTASRIVEGEAIIFTPEDSTIHSLNEVGTRIWELLEEERSIEDIVKTVCNEYEIEEKEAEQDIVEFIKELHGKKIVDVKDS